MLDILVLLLGMPSAVVCLTPETDVAVLFGQCTPGGGKKQTSSSDTTTTASSSAATFIKWQDGQVTKAARSGSWLRLDNLQDCEALIAERMNPVLELPPYLYLTEKGEEEDKQVPIASSFQVLL